MEIANQITNWLSLLAIVIAFIISIRFKDRKSLLPIKLYIFVSIVANLIFNVFDTFLSNSSFRNLEQITFNIYSLLEISLIYYFLLIRVKGKAFRATMFTSLVLYISIC